MDREEFNRFCHQREQHRRADRERHRQHRQALSVVRDRLQAESLLDVNVNIALRRHLLHFMYLLYQDAPNLQSIHSKDAKDFLTLCKAGWITISSVVTLSSSGVRAMHILRGANLWTE